MVALLLILWYTFYFDGLCTVSTLGYNVFRWLDYCWYLDILSTSMVGVVLILWDTKYFDGWCTVDTSRYFVFRRLTYCWYFELLSISMIDVLLTLWDTSILMAGLLLILRYTEYFDGWRSVDTLRYLVFRLLTYCWCFDILSIWMVHILLILWGTVYFDGWRTVDTLGY